MRFPVLAALLLLATDAFASDLDLRPRWSAGDRQVLTLERQRQDTRRAGRTLVGRSTITITVLRTTPTGYETRWTFGTFTLEGAPAEEGQFLRELLNLVAGLQCDLAIDADGTITRLLNWKAVKTAIDAASTRVVERLRQAGLPSQLLSSIKQFSDVFDTEEKVLEFGLREISLYHAVFGRTYSADAPARYEATLESPLGGEPIPTRGQITLGRLDTAAGRAYIDWTHTTDPEAASRVVAKATTELALRMGRSAPSPRDIPRIEVDESSRYVVDIRRGRVTSLRNTRTIKSSTATDSATRVDTLILSETVGGRPSRVP